MNKLLFTIAFSMLLTFPANAQNMKREYINATPGYTNVVAVTMGNFKTLYIAGQVGSGDTMHEQFESSFRSLLGQLDSAEAKFSDIVKMTLYIVDYKEEYLGIISQVREQVFGTGKMPAITMVGVSALALEKMKVETEAVAIVKIE